MLDAQMLRSWLSGREKVSRLGGVRQGELNKKAPSREGASMRGNFARVYDTEARVFPSEAWGRCRVTAPTCYFPSSLTRARSMIVTADGFGKGDCRTVASPPCRELECTFDAASGGRTVHLPSRFGGKDDAESQGPFTLVYRGDLGGKS